MVNLSLPVIVCSPSSKVALKHFLSLSEKKSVNCVIKNCIYENECWACKRYSSQATGYQDGYYGFVVAVFTNVKSPVLVISGHCVLPLMRSCILPHISGTRNPVVGLILQINNF